MRFDAKLSWFLCLTCVLTACEGVIKRPCWSRCFYKSPPIRKNAWQRAQYFTPNFNLTTRYRALRGSGAQTWSISLKDFNPVGLAKLYVKSDDRDSFHIGFASDPVRLQELYSEYHPGEIIDDFGVKMDVVVNNGHINSACDAASLKYNLPAKWVWDGQAANSVHHRGEWHYMKNQPLQSLDGQYDIKFPYQDRDWSVCIAFYFEWRTYTI